MISVNTSIIDKKDAVDAIRSVVRPDAQLVVVHSQVGAFGPMQDPVEELLESLLEALPENATLAMPVFTFDFISSGSFEHAQQPSETGLLTERFRRSQGVLRTRHPIYSFAIKGPLAARLAKIQGETCWGEATFFEAMEELDAEVVMLGSNWEQCTLFHRVEQTASVPYRYPKTFSGVARFDESDTAIETEMLVRRLDRSCANNFRALSESLRERGSVRKAVLGRGIVEACGAQAILKAGRALLQNDLLALLAEPEAYRREEKRWRVALLSSANLDTFSGFFAKEAEEWIREGVCVYVPPFNQYRQELLTQDSALQEFGPEWLVFLERSQDILGTLIEESGELSADGLRVAIEDCVASYLGSIRSARARFNGQIIVSSFDVPTYSPYSAADTLTETGHHKIIEYANLILRENIAELGDTILFDFERAAATFGREAAIDLKFWYIGRIPFSRNFSYFLSRRLVGLMLAKQGKTARLIVTDLDDTLWGGTVGEDGEDAVAIGSDYPGNAFSDFQRSLKALSRRGLALAICSRNTEEIALRVFENRREMVLTQDDFVSRRINWQDKAQNIREIADELGLGTGSICFLDDDPHQRELVRQQIPDAFVPELPSDPGERSAFVMQLPCLELLELTREDSRRVEQYKSRVKVLAAREVASSLEDFYRGLEMELVFERADLSNKARIQQLIAKTNQFNTTTKRYSEVELENLLDRGETVWAIGLADRFSALEIIGVVIVCWGDEEAEIDSFILSCRVLGRSVETGILGQIADRARGLGKSAVRARIVQTSRNQPARGVYTENGFDLVGTDEYLLDLRTSSLSVPDWFKVQSESQ